MTDLNTAVFLSFLAIMAVPSVLTHVYVYHVLWNRMDTKVWNTAVRESNNASTVYKYFMSFIWSTGAFCLTLIVYCIYISATKDNSSTYYPVLAVCGISLLIKYYSPNLLLVSISAIFAVLYAKHFYPNFFLWNFINEFAIIVAYADMLIVNIMMNKTYIKTFKSVNAND